MICLMNENPKFYSTVEIDGKKFATIKAKTHLDDAELQERCYVRKKGKDGVPEFDVLFEKMNIIRIRQALTEDEKCGWEIDKPVTEDNISLLPDPVYRLLLSKINEIDKSWQDENLAGNSD